MGNMFLSKIFDYVHFGIPYSLSLKYVFATSWNSCEKSLVSSPTDLFTAAV
jgi:hypothetical protein